LPRNSPLVKPRANDVAMQKNYVEYGPRLEKMIHGIRAETKIMTVKR